ncbi:MAG: class I SAM-dependent methyltransferase [Candidatus Bathyarchaeota archaeon]|nr:class I SAM-dependent methyltransferase [Candidatus Bathyarchaeota archaeon]
MEKVVIKHFIEQFREGWVRETKVRSFDELTGNLLEVGCGPQLTYFSRNAAIYGIDITPSVIKLFKKRYPWVHAIVGDAKWLPFRKRSFDVIVSTDLLHHLVGRSPRECQSKIRDAIKEMKYIMKPQGILLIQELLVRNAMFSYFTFYFTFLCAKLGIDIPALDIHSCVITFFLAKEMFKKMAPEEGFKIKEAISKDWMLKGRGYRRSILKVGKKWELRLTK